MPDSLIYMNIEMNRVSIFNFTVVTTGSSETFSLPLVSSGAYNFLVQWGDGSFDKITSWTQIEATHTYASADTYDIIITGLITGFKFGGAGDKTKIYDIKNWGPLEFGVNAGHFDGCTNLTVSASDVPGLSGVNSLNASFRNCSSLVTIPNFGDWPTSAISNWGFIFRNDVLFNEPSVSRLDTSSADLLSAMFLNADAFDQDISQFDISNVVAAAVMFGSGSGLSTANYDLLLLGWEAQDVKDAVAFAAGSATYSAGAPATARANLIADHSWIITDSGPA